MIKIKNSEICADAEKILSKYGWCKKTHCTEKGEVCLTEAIYYAARGKDVGEVFQALMTHTSTTDLAKWNDAQVRTKTEVLAALGKVRQLFIKNEKQI